MSEDTKGHENIRMDGSRTEDTLVDDWIDDGLMTGEGMNSA